MPVTNYHTVNGEIIGETTVGSPRVDYLTDALGSVTATVNQSAQVVNTYRYNPFGSLLAKTGSGPDPAFGWVGGGGYQPTGNEYAEFSAVLRDYAVALARRWSTPDPIGIFGGSSNFFEYVGNGATTWTDPLGLQGGCNAGYPADPWGLYKGSPGAYWLGVCLLAACADGDVPRPSLRYSRAHMRRRTKRCRLLEPASRASAA